MKPKKIEKKRMSGPCGHFFEDVPIYCENDLRPDEVKRLLMEPDHPYLVDPTRREQVLDAAQFYGPVQEITEYYIKFKDDQNMFLSTLHEYERGGGAESSGHPSGYLADSEEAGEIAA